MFNCIINLLFTDTTIAKLLNTINTIVILKKLERPLFLCCPSLMFLQTLCVKLSVYYYSLL